MAGTTRLELATSAVTAPDVTSHRPLIVPRLKVLFISVVSGLGVRTLYSLIRVKSPAPPIGALLGLLGMVIGEQFGIWVQAKKLDISHAASVCLVGERYDRPHRSEAP